MKISCAFAFLFFLTVPSWGSEQPPSFTYEDLGRRDPFAPFTKEAIVEDAQLTVKIKELQTLQVSGILWDEKKPLAMIQDQIFEVGDVCFGAVVKEIKKTEVILEYQGEIVILTVKIEEDTLGF